MVQISKKYNTDCSYQFKKFNIDTSKREFVRPWGYDLLYKFENIRTPEEAYIFGFFLSDGSISSDNYILKFHQKEREILEKIRDYICPKALINSDNKNHNLIICSKEIFTNLTKNFKVSSNKTYQDFNIPSIDPKLHSHFIRGYFDGDGSVYLDRGKYLRWNIASITKTILLEIQEILKKEGIEVRFSTEVRKGKNLNALGRYSTEYKNMHRIKISNKENLLKIYNYLYADATFYIKRKRNIFENNMATLS